MKRPVFCGQDLLDLVGFTITRVDSDEFDTNVSVWLEKESETVEINIKDGVFDGENMFIED